MELPGALILPLGAQLPLMQLRMQLLGKLHSLALRALQEAPWSHAPWAAPSAWSCGPKCGTGIGAATRPPWISALMVSARSRCTVPVQQGQAQEPQPGAGPPAGPGQASAGLPPVPLSAGSLLGDMTAPVLRSLVAILYKISYFFHEKKKERCISCLYH
jgi:hypothetical protein